MEEILHQLILYLNIIPLFAGFHTSHRVQDFFHQQYLSIWEFGNLLQGLYFLCVFFFSWYDIWVPNYSISWVFFRLAATSQKVNKDDNDTLIPSNIHQEFQVPKMEVLNHIRLFWGWVFPYISLINGPRSVNCDRAII